MQNRNNEINRALRDKRPIASLLPPNFPASDIEQLQYHELPDVKAKRGGLVPPGLQRTTPSSGRVMRNGIEDIAAAPGSVAARLAAMRASSVSSSSASAARVGLGALISESGADPSRSACASGLKPPQLPQLATLLARGPSICIKTDSSTNPLRDAGAKNDGGGSEADIKLPESPTATRARHPPGRSPPTRRGSPRHLNTNVSNESTSGGSSTDSLADRARAIRQSFLA
eukprot:SAG31_NODE_513_length_14715_cov_22.844554_3_plen_229_part_00